MGMRWRMHPSGGQWTPSIGFDPRYCIRCDASSSLVQVYQDALLGEDALWTKATTSGVIWALSDWLAQKSEGREAHEVQGLRILRFCAFGALVNAPMFDFYYFIQDQVIEGETLVPRLVKLSIDQLLWTPFIYLPTFFGGMALLEGRSTEEAVVEVQRKGFGLTRTLIANWKFWVPVNVCTYFWIPLEYRVLWNNAASLAWTIFLSRTQNTTTTKDKEGREEG